MRHPKYDQFDVDMVRLEDCLLTEVHQEMIGIFR